MHKIISILAIGLLAFNCQLIGQGSRGISFSKQENWEDVLARAAIENKPVFVDMYTTWCAPCKVMDKKIFVDEQVGTFFNKHFINIKMDAEKGQGKMINENYKVDSYPTFLFIDSKGQLFLKHIGSLDAENFLSVANAALKEFKEPKPIAIWDDEYKNNKELKLDWVYNYIFKRKSLGLDVKDVIEKYLSILPQDSLTSTQVEKVITYNIVSLNGIGMNLLLKMYEKDPYTNVLTGPYWALRRVIDEALQTAAQNKDTSLLINVISLSDKMYKETFIRKRVADMLYIKYFGIAKDTQMVKKLSKKYAEEYILSVNIDSLREMDSIRFRQAVLFTFSTLDIVSLSKQKKYKDFARLYRSECKNRADDILGICNILCNACGPNIEDRALLNEAERWLNRGYRFYPDRKVYEIISKNVKECLENPDKFN